jgi:hypothetical protein
MLKKVLNRLVTVKSIVTLVLTAVFAFLSATGAISPDSFKEIFYIVIAFYFGSSLEKTAKSVGTETE